MEVAQDGEWGLAELAQSQHGFVHRSQILALGISRGSIRHRRERGRLHDVFPAVFAVGHTAPTPLGLPTAALLYAEYDAALSHAMAAALWGIIEPPREVTLTVMRRLSPDRACGSTRWRRSIHVMCASATAFRSPRPLGR